MYLPAELLMDSLFTAVAPGAAGSTRVRPGVTGGLRLYHSPGGVVVVPKEMDLSRAYQLPARPGQVELGSVQGAVGVS